jgi:4-hydroxy-tetrahydrodipicolinate reductase
MLNIAISGYGEMGRLIQSIAEDAGHTVKAIIDPVSESSAVTSAVLDASALKGCEVVIDFTVPSSAVSNIEVYAEAGIPVVMGTTGWYERLDEVTDLINSSGIGMIWSGNFSLGVNALFAIVRHAGSIMNRLPEYDCMVHEYHHKRKADSPSGTADMIGKILVEQLDKKERVVTDALYRKIEDDELHVSSTRGGHIPGTHTITFDSEVDTISVTHTARGRKGFAVGAVKAAEWIKGRQGIFSIDAMMHNMLGLGE